MTSVGVGWRGAKAGLWRVLALGLAGALALGGPACRRSASPSQQAEAIEPPPSVSGTLRVAAYGDGSPAAYGDGSPAAYGDGSSAAYGDGSEGPRLRHVHSFVNGPEYQGMEDNDLRGFLDGRFIYGWNQPGQIHNRLGRRRSRPRWGETELFRTLLRWQGIHLPPGAQVHEAEIEIDLEDTPGRALRVLLYEVKKEWNPGQGGERHDNTSPPLPGEVWWGAVAEGEVAWGFPGAGFASESHPDADTPVDAVAEARVEPEQQRVVFRSLGLARLVEERGRAGRPLGLLLKVSDDLEDTPDSLLYIYSGNHGDRRNPARRPRLHVAWEAPRQVAGLERPLLLEHGRSLDLGRLETPGARSVAVSFEPDEGHESPTLWMRGGARGEAPGPWLPAVHPRSVQWDWVEVRVVAAVDPVILGQPFETGFRDTWVRSGPPEDQEVVFDFVSPGGAAHRVLATYEGDYTWSVAFPADELGRWRYTWTSAFLKRPVRSAEGRFDVVPGDLANVEAQLRRLLDRVRREPGSDAHVPPLAPAFWQLERAVYRLAAPAWMASEEGRGLYQLMTDVRVALSGREVPERALPAPMQREY